MLYFVINPKAKSNYGWFIWKKVEKELKKRQISYQYYVTKREKEAVVYARKLTQGKRKRKIVILGGDGTLNEFLNGMQRTQGIEIAYLPIGSGNDFARGMQIGKDYKKELLKILDGDRKEEIDYGTVTYPSGRKKRFLVSAGIGYDAKVCYEANRTKWKKVLNYLRLGKLIYVIVGVKDLLKAEVFSGTLVVDDREVLSGEGFLFLSFHNLPFEGGGFQFCPKAEAGDGYLDICVAKGIAKWKIPMIIPQAICGKHTKRKGVYQFRCKEAWIKTKEKQYVHTDGETKRKESQIRITISEEKIRFFGRG